MNAARLYKLAEDSTLATRPDHVSAIRSAAWAQAFPFDEEPRGDEGLAIQSRLVQDHALIAAEISTTHSLQIEELALGAQTKIQEGGALSAKMRVESLEKSTNLKDKQADFQKRRNEVARLTALRRANALVQPGGALNYQERMSPISDRITNDFTAAFQRLLAAAEGLSHLYGYRHVVDTFPGPESKVRLDDVVTWCQHADTWIAALQGRERSFTRTLSIKHVVGDAAFSAGKSKGLWMFDLSPAHFLNRPMIRLRGVGAQVRSDRSFGSWNIALTPPVNAILVRENQDPPVPLVQPDSSPLLLGQVCEEAYSVFREGFVGPALYNLSPIGDGSSKGTWVLEVLGESSFGMAANKIEDIVLHFSVATL